MQANDSPNLRTTFDTQTRPRRLQMATKCPEGDAKKIIEAIVDLNFVTETPDEQTSEIKYIQPLVEDIDNANDTAKIPNALETINNFAHYKLNTDEANNFLILDIRAQMAQNNPFCLRKCSIH